MAWEEGAKGRKCQRRNRYCIEISTIYLLAIRFLSLVFVCVDADDFMYIYVSPNEPKNKNPASVCYLPCVSAGTLSFFFFCLLTFGKIFGRSFRSSFPFHLLAFSCFFGCSFPYQFVLLFRHHRSWTHLKPKSIKQVDAGVVWSRE